jgi:hypothetical protein
MRPENLREYELTRQELLDLKRCMTDYVGFMLRGAGLAVVVLSLAAHFGMNSMVMFSAFLGLSLVLTLVMYVLFYKFNSHNRYAAYALVLSMERWSDTIPGVNDLFMWERSLAKLRDFDLDPKFALNMLHNWPNGMTDDRFEKALSMWADGMHRSAAADWLKGLGLLTRFLTGHSIPSGSWAYPMWVTVPFAVIAAMFVCVPVFIASRLIYLNWGMLFGQAMATVGSPSQMNLWGIAVVAVIILVLQFRLWQHLLSKLYRIMIGSATISAYCIRFEFIRMLVLSEYRISPIYPVDTNNTQPGQHKKKSGSGQHNRK